MRDTLVKQSNIKIKFIPSYENVTITKVDITEGIISLLFKFNEVKMNYKTKNRYAKVTITGEVIRHISERDIISKDPRKYLGRIFHKDISSIIDEDNNEYSKTESACNINVLANKLSTFYTEIEILD